MLLRAYITIALLLGSAFCTAQENLVVNYNFDDIYRCPNTGGQIFLAKGWSAGLSNWRSSTDFYHSCMFPETVNIPSSIRMNSTDTIHVVSGNGCAGTGYGWDVSLVSGGLREFLTGSLSACLIKDSVYEVSLFVRFPIRNTLFRFTYDCFQIYFHNNEHTLDSPLYNINHFRLANPHITFDSPFIRPEMGWVQLKTDYTATGDECNYFTFGCFKEYYETNVQVVYPNAIASVYYFYDAFSIRLKQSPPDTLKARYEPPIIPNVITPNGDGLNDVLLIKNLPSGSKLQVFNRWGQLVYSQPNYDNSWAAEGMPDGTYYVEVQFEALPPKRQALQIIRQ